MGVLNAKTFNKALKARRDFTEVNCEELDCTVRLGRLTAAQGLKLGKRYNAVPKDAEGNPKDEEDLAEFFVWLLSLAIVNEEGEPFLSSDEGRVQIGSLSFGTITQLGTEAMVVNGMAERDDTKKKTGKPGTSAEKKMPQPSASVENSGD